MKNDEFGRALNRELSGVRISPELRSRILRAAEREKRRRPGFSGAAAIAAAAVLLVGMAAGFAFLRGSEAPDNVTSPGGNISPAVTNIYTPAPESAAGEQADLSGMWVNGEDGMFHLYKACALSGGNAVHITETFEIGALSPCPACFDECLWIDTETDRFHEDYDCPEMNAPLPVNMGILAQMDYISCEECTVQTGSEITTYMPTEEPAYPEETQFNAGEWMHSVIVEDEAVLSTPEPTPSMEWNEGQNSTPAASYHDAEKKKNLLLTGWAAQNMAVNWGLTPGGRGMVFTGSAIEPDEHGEITDADTLEDPELDYCWCTENGQFIHSVGNCSSMKDSFLALITPALGFSGNKEPCPECKSALGNVYYTKSGKHFHSAKNCSGMKGAESHTRRAAYAAGKIPCPTCLEYESENPAE